MNFNTTTARGRELGARLTHYRVATGWTRRLGRPTEKCVPPETGQGSPSRHDLSVFLTECGVPASQRAALPPTRFDPPTAFRRAPRSPRTPELLPMQN